MQARTVLFSHPEVIAYINERFEPAWEAVSALPYYDYGEKGGGAQRIATGNIATQICNAEGRVLDVLPSLYSETDYRQGLEQAWRLAKYLEGCGAGYTRDFLKWFHKRKSEVLAKANARQPNHNWHLSMSNHRIGALMTMSPDYPFFRMSDEARKSELAQSEEIFLANGKDAPDRPLKKYRAASEFVVAAAESAVASRSASHRGPAQAAYAQAHDWTNQYPYYQQRVHDLLLEKAGAFEPGDLTRTLFREIFQLQFLDDLCLGKIQPPASSPVVAASGEAADEAQEPAEIGKRVTRGGRTAAVCGPPHRVQVVGRLGPRQP